MYRGIAGKFLTLVLVSILIAGATLPGSIARANPHAEAPTSDAAAVEEVTEEPPEAFKNDRLAVTPVETNEPKNMHEYSRRFSKADYFYPYRQTLSPRVGTIFGLRDSSDEKDLMNLLMGFNYLIPRHSSPQFEVGADLSLANHGHLNFMRRHIYNERGSFRPYYKYGVTHKIVAKEKFATFSNWDNYLARMGVGFEDIVRPPRSLRLELEAAVGAEDVFVVFTYGYSFGW
jgi:hypothetical protein